MPASSAQAARQKKRAEILFDPGVLITWMNLVTSRMVPHCVPRFKFALRGALQARQIERKLIKEDEALGCFALEILGQPRARCGFVFKIAISGNVLFEITIFGVRK